MKKLVYLSHFYIDAANASSKPIKDIEIALRRFGGKTIGLRSRKVSYSWHSTLMNYISTILAMLFMPRHAGLLLQFPNDKCVGILTQIAHWRDSKVIAVVHDIDRLRMGEKHRGYLKLKHMDALIVHTPNMKQWLSTNLQYNGQIIELGIFDYITKQSEDSVQYALPLSVVFAGNLYKSTFLQQINWTPTDCVLNLYGAKCPDEVIQKDCIHYCGVSMPDELPHKLTSSNFGLVWDGDSASCCSGPFGEYLKYNAPHKFSLYIAAGLPVIVWSKMGLAAFVEQNHIGLCVDSLDEIPQRLKTIDLHSYNTMLQNVRQLQDKVIHGDMLITALDKALDAIG